MGRRKKQTDKLLVPRLVAARCVFSRCLFLEREFWSHSARTQKGSCRRLLAVNTYPKTSTLW